MSRTRRVAWAVAVVGLAFSAVLFVLWAVVAPLLLEVPRTWWLLNAATAGGMVLAADLIAAALNVLFRYRWKRRRLAELPIRQLGFAIFSVCVAVALGWAVALYRIPSPYGVCLAVVDVGLGAFAAIGLLVSGRALIRGPLSRLVSQAHPAAGGPRFSWSRVGIRGYLLVAVVVLGSASALVTAAYGHVAVHRGALRQQIEESTTLLNLVARRLESLPRERLLTQVWRMPLGSGTLLRLVDRGGRAVLPGESGQDRSTRRALVQLHPGGRCSASTARPGGCRWTALVQQHEGLALVAMVWPRNTITSERITAFVAVFALILLILAGIVANVMGRDVTRELTVVGERIRAIADRAEEGIGSPLQPTSSDEMGDLVRSFCELREVLADELAHTQHHVSRSAAADRAKTEFLEEVSYELRTPLTSLIGNAELLLEGARGPLNETQKQDVAILLDSSHQLLGLIQDILDVSFCEVGDLQLRLEACDLGNLIQSEVAAARAAMKGESVALGYDVPQDLPPVVLDPVRVRRVLANLLSNATKFTEAGEIRVRCTLMDDGWVQIGVLDTGPGIPPEYQAVIFKQYRQAPQDRPKQLRGSGLGLAIADQLVGMHGGRIWLESTLGTGSDFLFTLPVSGPIREAKATREEPS